jgi:hypothetical protein
MMSIEIAFDSDDVSFRVYFFTFPLNGVAQNVSKVIIVVSSRLTANAVQVLVVEAMITVLFGNISWSGSTVHAILMGPPVKRTRSVHVSMTSDCWNPEQVETQYNKTKGWGDAAGRSLGHRHA